MMGLPIDVFKVRILTVQLSLRSWVFIILKNISTICFHVDIAAVCVSVCFSHSLQENFCLEKLTFFTYFLCTIQYTLIIRKSYWLHIIIVFRKMNPTY
jgi:hypothetical protein